MQNIEDLLEHQRKKLLDTSRRNPLLNYRMTSKAIEITSEWPQDIFHHLVNRGKSMNFLAKIESENEKEIEGFKKYIEESIDQDLLDSHVQSDDESYINELTATNPFISLEGMIPEQEKQSSPMITVKNTLKEYYNRAIHLGKLPTDHTTEDLKKRLKDIYRDIQRFNKELGTNPYYLTLGMLEWEDTKRSQEVSSAPILLIPVEILQKNRFADFEVQYTDEEVEFNETLSEKLLEDFNLQLSSHDNINSSNIQEYFTLLEGSVKDLGWKVDRTKLTLTIFASKKFLMHRDLKIDSWPIESSPHVNQTLDRLLHGGFQRSWQYTFQRTHLVDSLISPMDNYQIYDADSSQMMAIHHVKNGYNLIIQGPPGTGKSQTITNIIAQAIGDDKTVLFVAQKETALNVVKTKLDRARLGQLCLELHGHKTKRGTFLNAIQQVLDYSNDISIQQTLGDIPGLIAVRDKLNNYTEALNTPIDGKNTTPFQCFEELLRLKDVLQDAEHPRWPDNDLFSHVSLKYHDWLPKIDNLQMLLAEIGLPKDNVFRFCQYSEDAFIAPEQTKQIIHQLQNSLDSLRETTIDLATHLRVSAPANKRQAHMLVYLSEHLLRAPLLFDVDIYSDKWQKNTKEILNTIEALRQSEELKRTYNSILKPEAWTRNIESLLQKVYANSNPIQRLFNLPVSAPDELVQLCFTEPPKNVKDQLSLLKAIISFQEHQKGIKDQEALFRELLGEQNWHQRYSDWKYLSNLNNWLTKLYQTIQIANLQTTVLDYLEDDIQSDELRNLCESVQKSLQQHETNSSSLVSHLLLDEEAQFGRGHNFITQSFAYQDELLNTWFNNINQLKDIIDYNRLKNELVKDGFASVIELGEVWPEASTYLVEIVKYIWFLHLINQNRKHKPELMSFNRVSHEANIQKFSELDVASFEENKSYLVSKYNEAILGLNSVEDQNIEGQLQLIKSQCMNAGGKLSIRKIMGSAGEVLQTLKPIFMMSPASVAEFLPPAKVKFDLIIFDEASQIRPEDATGAILRGNQTVVVGDRFQLPPTDFFATTTGQANLEGVIDAESILDLFYIRGVPESTLLWHYRSQHHSLITPSNHVFYDNELIVFPSPKARDKKLGVSLVPIHNSVYDRGGSRTNLVEARNVAQAVIHHAATDPNLSLGVVALNKEQAEAIDYEITLQRDQNPNFEAFFQDEERFFVTNLENVQGDERDVIFISIGYGFSKEGKLTLNFGPISQERGDRRLNVLTTRAKKRCLVFSSIRARDIYERKPSSRGARFLAEYLEYAETGLTKSYEEMQNVLYQSEDYQEKRERLKRLALTFNEKFSLEDIRSFCFHLDVDYENLPGDTKQGKARELAYYFHRRENINHLIQVGKQQRPDIDWSEFEGETVEELPNDNTDKIKEDSHHPLPTLEDSFQKNQKHSYQISQFEKEVSEALEAYEYCVKKHVGPPNAAIPLAVMDKDQQTALLGIEFDGPNYYQARSARDRDRLRRQELEKLQWNIHRMWIIDWYYNKERELARLINVIEGIQQQRKFQI